MSDWRTITQSFSERVTPEEQRKRDQEALRLKKSERGTTGDAKAEAALERDIARTETAAGEAPDWQALTQSFAPPVGGGRGDVVEQPGERAAYLAQKEVPSFRGVLARGVKRTARSEVSPFESAARGAVTGLTAGLGKYPAAGAMVGMDILAGKGDLTYKQALEEIRAQEALDRAVNPASTFTGTVAGAAGPLGRLKAAQQPLRTLAATTGYGAASGFSERPMEEGTTLQDVGVGGAFGLLGGGANVAAARTIMNRLNAAALPGAREALRTGRAAVPVDVNATNMSQIFEKGGVLVAKDGKSLLKAGQRELERLNAQWLVANSPAEDIVAFARSSPYVASTKGVQGAAQSVLPSTLLGAVSGGIGAPFIGQDPLTGALAGAGAGFGMGKANTLNAAREAATRGSASFATLAGAPRLGSVVSPAVTATTAAAVPELVLRPQPFTEPVRQRLAERVGLVTQP